jgi:hypothetical protein
MFLDNRVRCRPLYLPTTLQPRLALDSPLAFRLYSSQFSNDREEYAERIWTERERRRLQAFLQISPPKVAPEPKSIMSVRSMPLTPTLGNRKEHGGKQGGTARRSRLP